MSPKHQKKLRIFVMEQLRYYKPKTDQELWERAMKYVDANVANSSVNTARRWLFERKLIVGIGVKQNQRKRNCVVWAIRGTPPMKGWKLLVAENKDAWMHWCEECNRYHKRPHYKIEKADDVE